MSDKIGSRSPARTAWAICACNLLKPAMSAAGARCAASRAAAPSTRCEPQRHPRSSGGSPRRRSGRVGRSSRESPRLPTVAEPLSHRGPADPKLKRQRAILDPAALRQDAANDRFAKRAVDKFAREAPLDEAGFDLRQLRPSSCATALRSVTGTVSSAWLCAERWFMRRSFRQRDPATLTIDIQQ